MSSTAATEVWGELLVVPENRSAVRAAGRLARGLAVGGRRTLFARPLLFHGPVGCGKSAIIRELIGQGVQSHSALTARIVPALEIPRDETDVSELTACDLLAVEDVQHLKSADVDTFCRLLDNRITRRKPTIITSSAGPAGLGELPRRLTNRLAGGLVIRIDPFSLSSRTLFAEWHSTRRCVRLSSEVLNQLACTAVSLRELIGLIDTVGTATSAGIGEMTEPAVGELLADSPPPTPILDAIVRTVGRAFRVKAKELTGPSRLRTVLVPRQVAMYLAREVGKQTLVSIGQYFGGRDHTTVLNAVRKVETAMRSDEALAGRVRELQRELG